MKIFWTVSNYREDTIFIRKISKGHNSIKNYVECLYLFSAYCLMMVYICTKFQENILNGIRVMEQTRKVNGRTDGQRRTDGGHDIIRPVFDGRIIIKIGGLPPLLVWVPLLIVKSYSEFQANIFSHNRVIRKCQSFRKRLATTPPPTMPGL